MVCQVIQVTGDIRERTAAAVVVVVSKYFPVCVAEVESTRIALADVAGRRRQL